MAGYVRFRAVCRPWRRCSVDPRSQGALDGRFLPRQWIMLDKAHAASCCHRFLNISTGECIRTDIPELADHTLLSLTPEGLLLLLHEPTLVIRLLNPLTRQLTDLPVVTALLPQEEQRAWRSGCPLEDTFGRVASADASTVAICFRCPTVLAVARPGDEHWTVVDDRCMDATMSCAGRFYCAIGSSVMVLDTSGQDQQQSPRLRPVAILSSKSFDFNPMSDSLHLVDNGGALMLVHRTVGLDTDAQGIKKYKRKYQVFRACLETDYPRQTPRGSGPDQRTSGALPEKAAGIPGGERSPKQALRVDLDAGVLAPAKDLRGQAVFMSLGRTITVSPGVFSSVAADTLYLGSDCNEKTMMNRIDGYNVADGSSEPSYRDSCHEMLVQPCSLVDCLAYCIQGDGEHLA